MGTGGTRRGRLTILQESEFALCIKGEWGYSATSTTHIFGPGTYKCIRESRPAKTYIIVDGQRWEWMGEGDWDRRFRFRNTELVDRDRAGTLHLTGDHRFTSVLQRHGLIDARSPVTKLFPAGTYKVRASPPQTIFIYEITRGPGQSYLDMPDWEAEMDDLPEGSTFVADNIGDPTVTN